MVDWQVYTHLWHHKSAAWICQWCSRIGAVPWWFCCYSILCSSWPNINNSILFMERIDLHLGIGRDRLVFQHGWDVYNFSWNSINLPAMIDAFHVSCVPVHFAQRQWGWPMWALIRHTVCLAGQISPKDQRISQKRCRHGTCCSRANLSSFGFGKIIAEGYGIPLLSNIQRQPRMEQATRDIFGPLRGRKQRLARIRHGINFFSRLKVCSNNSEFKAATVDLLGTKRNGYFQALGPRQYIQFVRFFPYSPLGPFDFEALGLLMEQKNITLTIALALLCLSSSPVLSWYSTRFKR